MCLFHYWLGPHNLIVLIVEMMGVVQVSLVTIYASSLGHNWVKSFLKKYALYHREQDRGILIQIFNIDLRKLQFSVLCAIRAVGENFFNFAKSTLLFSGGRGGFIFHEQKTKTNYNFSTFKCLHQKVGCHKSEKKFNFGCKEEIYTLRAQKNPNKPCIFISLGKLGRFTPKGQTKL